MPLCQNISREINRQILLVANLWFQTPDLSPLATLSPLIGPRSRFPISNSPAIPNSQIPKCTNPRGCISTFSTQIGKSEILRLLYVWGCRLIIVGLVCLRSLEGEGNIQGSHSPRTLVLLTRVQVLEQNKNRATRSEAGSCFRVAEGKKC
jgi:hypothetical protein